MQNKKFPGKSTKFQDSNWGRCGYELNLYQARHAKSNPLLVLKGGLGDAGSHSLKPVTEAILDITHGKMSIGTVGTLRPFNLYESLKILYSSTEQSRARKQRMHSMNRATEKAISITGCGFVLLGGQSQGGVTAVDTGLRLMNAETAGTKPRMAVATIDTPGVYHNLEYAGFPLKGLVDLGAHCIPTIAKLSNYEKFRLIRDNLKNPRLVLELPYLLGEIDYLKSIGIHEETSALRMGGVAVGHIFHNQDIIEGAVDAVQDSSAVIFPGTHTTFMIEPEPVAEVLVNMAYTLHDNPSNVINLSECSSSIYVPKSILV